MFSENLLESKNAKEKQGGEVKKNTTEFVVFVVEN